MKKLNFFGVAMQFTITFGILLCSCSKSGNDDRVILKNELSKNLIFISSSKLDATDFMEYSITNCDNPFESAGIYSITVSKKFIKEIESKKSDPDSIINQFVNVLNSGMPESLKVIDSTDFDSLEKTIQNTLYNIYINECLENFVVKSKKIENLVCESKYFTDNQKKRVLINSSVMRQEIGLFENYFSDSKEMKPKWGQCMKKKLEDLQN